jgi:hypothetical protein
MHLAFTSHKKRPFLQEAVFHLKNLYLSNCLKFFPIALASPLRVIAGEAKQHVIASEAKQSQSLQKIASSQSASQ